jgi:hypothetical protein
MQSADNRSGDSSPTAARRPAGPAGAVRPGRGATNASADAGDPERRLRALMEDRLGRPCLPLPSGRLALWLALTHWFAPGERILVSPVNDDVILFVVLSAGLRPVSAPLSPTDGNIDVDAVEGAVWQSLAGVLTTNLYGLPDRVNALHERCRRFGLVLIEDACHAIETTVDGRPVGTFGAAAAFSLSKHAAAMAGGFLAVADAAELSALERRRDEVLTGGAVHREAVTVLNSAIRPWVKRSALAGPSWRALKACRLLERDGYRMDLREGELALARARAPDLPAFDPWVRVDLHDYRRRSGTLLLRWMRGRLAALDDPDLRRARRNGVARLAAAPAAAPAVRADPAQPLFRVPLLIRDRDRAVAELEKAGIVTGYLYDPPLDDYAGPAVVDPSPAPGPARWWARHVLPVDPLAADRTLGTLDRIGIEAMRWTEEQSPRVGPAPPEVTPTSLREGSGAPAGSCAEGKPSR